MIENDCVGCKVIRGLHADSAQSWEDYQTDSTRKNYYKRLLKIKNLYQINRTGVDKSIYAGVMAARSIIEKIRRPSKSKLSQAKQVLGKQLKLV